MAKFQKGHKPPVNPRTGKSGPAPVRVNLPNELKRRLSEHFAEIGHRAIDIVFKEDPATYLRIVASLVPKELFIAHANVGPLGELSDEQLLETLEHIRSMKAIPVNGSGSTEH